MKETDTIEDAQSRIAELRQGLWSFAAFAAAMESGLLDAVDERRTAADAAARAGVDTRLAQGMLDVLGALGVVNADGERYAAASGMRQVLGSPARGVIEAVVRSEYLQAREMVDGARRGDVRSGWDFHDLDIIRSQGSTGRAIRQAAEQIFPMLGDLEQRLRNDEPSFLDVGTGQGTISIELCRMYPKLRAVGIDPFEPALEEARKCVSEAGLSERIELRDQRIEELADDRIFDLAFFPQVFMPEDVVATGLENIRRALAPGGWCLTIAFDDPPSELDAALYRLRNVYWGGDAVTPEVVAAMMRDAGFVHVQPAPEPAEMFRPVVGMRSPA